MNAVARRRGTGRHAESDAGINADGGLAPSSSATSTEDPAVDDDSGILQERLYLQAKSEKRSVKRLPALVVEAMALVWTTSRIGTVNVVAVQFLAAGVAAIQVIVGGYAVNQLVVGGGVIDVGAVLPPLLLLAVVTMLGSLGTSGMSQLGRLLGVRVQRRVQARVLDVTTSVELVEYDDPSFYDQLQRVMANVPTQPYNVVTSMATLVGGVVGAGSLVVTLIVIQPLLVVLLLVAGPPLWWLSRRGGNLEFTFAKAQAEPFRERQYVSTLLSERTGAAEVRAYRTAPWLLRRWNTSYDAFVDAMRRQIRKRYALNAASTVATGLVTILTLVTLVLLIDRGEISVGAAASAAVAIRLLAGRLQQFFGGLTSLFEASVFLGDFTQFLGRSGDISMRVRTVATSTVPAGAVEPVPTPLRGVSLRGVSFRYPSSSTDAVRNVSLELRPGEVVALVGENGSGKTTLAKLISGLYTPSSGELTWSDGMYERSLNGLDGRLARERIGLVLQDFTRYQLSAADNIALGRPEKPADPVLIEAAASHVGADAFINQLPRRFDTRLARQFRGGRELSQGQWQRVALARVFYRDADLVILDEPTAALDPRAEHQLFRSVRDVLAGRTVVLITHRLRSVQEADRIVVLAEGRIAEQGDHAALMATGGLYSELVALQASGGLAQDEDLELRANKLR